MADSCYSWNRTSMSPPRDTLTIYGLDIYHVEWSHWSARWYVKSALSGYNHSNGHLTREAAKRWAEFMANNHPAVQ